MKKFKLTYILFLSFLFACKIFSNELLEKPCKDDLVKFYMDINDLAFDSNRIFLIEEGVLTPVKAFYSNKKG